MIKEAKFAWISLLFGGLAALLLIPRSEQIIILTAIVSLVGFFSGVWSVVIGEKRKLISITGMFLCFLIMFPALFVILAAI